MPHILLCQIYVFQEYAHVENEKPVFEFLEYSVCIEIMIL